MASDEFDDDRDRQDYDDRPSPKRKGGLSKWWILGGVGCLLLLGCGGGCVAFIVWGVKSLATDLPAANASADGFLNSLQQGQTDAAYAATTAEFKRRQTPDEFRAFVGRFGMFAAHTSRTTSGLRLFHDQNGKRATVQVTLQSPNNAMTCTLVLVEEGGEWRVNSVTVP